MVGRPTRAEQWPDPVNRAFKHLNPNVYVPMQGPSELGASGKLVDWDRTTDLGKFEVRGTRGALVPFDRFLPRTKPDGDVALKRSAARSPAS